MVPTTASRTPLRARPIRASSRPNKPTWSGGRSRRVVSFRGRVDAFWEAYEQWADTHLTVSQPAPRRLRKGAPDESPRRNRPGDRNPFRPAGTGGRGLGSRGDGGAATGSAPGRASAGTTAERRHFRSCRVGIALLLRRTGPVSPPPREETWESVLGPMRLR